MLERCLLTSIAAVLFLGGCASSELARQRKQLDELREQVGQLRDDLTALQDLLNRRAAPSQARRVKIIGKAHANQQITVLAESLLVNGNEVTMEVFREFIVQLAQQDPNSAVTVIAKRRLSRARVEAIVKELRDAGLQRISRVNR